MNGIFCIFAPRKIKNLESIMTEYTIKILGAQYAANPDYKFGDPETPEMWARTIDLLSNLRDMRPRVVLKLEPTNPCAQWNRPYCALSAAYCAR